MLECEAHLTARLAQADVRSGGDPGVVSPHGVSVVNALVAFFSAFGAVLGVAVGIGTLLSALNGDAPEEVGRAGNLGLALGCFPGLWLGAEAFSVAYSGNPF
jgi:hypothetical protein